VRQRYLERCDHAALALYLVLVTVADAEGLSYYSDESLERMLRLDHAGLSAARSALVQVLALESAAPLPPTSRSGQVRSLKAILAQVLEQGGQP
jgi:hypothetical protein